jgi:hypothetical protein
MSKPISTIGLLIDNELTTDRYAKNHCVKQKDFQKMFPGDASGNAALSRG